MKEFFLIFCFIIIINFNIHFIEATPLCNIEELSFDLCYANLNCRSKLFIDENNNDTDTFNWLLYRVITAYRLNDVIEGILCNNNSTEVQDLWVSTLSTFTFCQHINEYFDGYLHSCQCKTDKICIHEDPNSKFFHFTSTQFFTWFILGLVVYGILYNNDEIRKLTRSILDISILLKNNHHQPLYDIKLKK